MNAKHTPGPWSIKDHRLQGLRIHAAVENSPSGIAHVYSSEPDPRANARLIAESPALLEAAEDLLAAKDKTNESLRERLRAAIARAKGEQT